MNRRMYFSIGLTTGALILGGSVATAQSTSEAKKAPATTMSSATPADAKLLDSAHATESTQKKHLAGVKYEDRVASTTAATPNVQAGKVAIDAPKPTANEMAIKENGISSSKPAAKPHQ